jgi:excisionase family DNA binding protein
MRRVVPSGPPTTERRFRAVEPISRTGVPESLSPQKVGNPIFPYKGVIMKTDTQLLLSVEEAADVLGLGRTRAYELVMAKKIQSVKVGRRRLVVRSSLLDFVLTLLSEQNCA